MKLTHCVWLETPPTTYIICWAHGHRGPLPFLKSAKNRCTSEPRIPPVRHRGLMCGQLPAVYCPFAYSLRLCLPFLFPQLALPAKKVRQLHLLLSLTDSGLFTAGGRCLIKLKRTHTRAHTHRGGCRVDGETQEWQQQRIIFKAPLTHMQARTHISKARSFARLLCYTPALHCTTKSSLSSRYWW